MVEDDRIYFFYKSFDPKRRLVVETYVDMTNILTGVVGEPPGWSERQVGRLQNPPLS